jgi:peroxiredoxin
MVTFKGQPVTLAGTPLKVGDKMPDFTLVGNALETVSLGDTAGVRLFLAVPSLDTAVCDLEVRTFNQKVGRPQRPSLRILLCKMRPLRRGYLFAAFTRREDGGSPPYTSPPYRKAG